MKKVIISVAVIIMIGFSSFVFASDGDIAVVEVREDVAMWKLEYVLFRIEEKEVKVMYKKYDVNNNLVGNKAVIFEGSDFPALITAINNGNNIEQTIKVAVKTKLGLP